MSVNVADFRVVGFRAVILVKLRGKGTNSGSQLGLGRPNFSAMCDGIIVRQWNGSEKG